MKKKIIASLMLSILALSFVSSALAENVPYSFSMTNTGTTCYVYSEQGNTKVNINDDAKIKCITTDAPGYGYYLGLCNSSYSQATVKKWYGVNGRTRKHEYLPGKAVVGHTYYITGRIDNDYTGTYDITGLFNSDNTHM